MNIQELAKNIERVRTNGQAIQRVMCNTLESQLDGDYDIVDPSNPFVFLMEAAAAGASAGQDQTQALLQKSFPSLAMASEDLYHHMSDYEYIGRFAQPAEGTFTLILAYEELLGRMIHDDHGYERIDIPRYSEISVEGLPFTLLEPIEIRRMPHGGLHVVYNTENPHPLSRIESNELDWQITKLPSGAGELSFMDILLIRIPLKQLKLNVHYEELKPSSTFSRSVPFDGHFHYARIFMERNDGWEILETTHSNEVYDPQKVSALLRVQGQRLQVRIPQIYFTNEQIERNLRIDIYTTQGDIDRDLNNYEPRAYQAQWRSIEALETQFNEPIRSFRTITLFSDDRLTGGRSELSFSKLKERVMNQAMRIPQVPITEKQLGYEIEDYGFKLIRNVDHLTNRLYVATRLPKRPENTPFRSRVGLSIETFSARAKDLSELTGVHDNGHRLTIGANNVFERTSDGLLRLLNREQINEIRNLEHAQQANYLNNHPLYFNPFYYVIDFYDDTIKTRAYDLDHPKVSMRHFIEENLNAQLQISTQRYRVEKVDEGYELYLITRTGEQLKEIGDSYLSCTLTYIIPQTNERVYLRGELLGRIGANEQDIAENEFLFRFQLKTNYEINEAHEILLTNLESEQLDVRNHRCELKPSFDILYVLDNYREQDIESTRMDRDLVAGFQFTAPYYALAHERIELNLGQTLEHLWQRIHPSVSELDYERYESDVYAYYEQTVFERDSDTGAIIVDYDESSDEFTYNVKHEAGDPVLDSNDEHVLHHAVGDVKYDANGAPIRKSHRYLNFDMDLVLMEGSFLFITDNNALEYRDQVIEDIKHWAEAEIGQIDDRLLENTWIYYRPPSTIGQTQVYVEDGRQVTINNQQSFVADIYLSDRAYRDLDLRERINKAILDAIESRLHQNVITTIEMANEVLDLFDSTDVLDVRIRGLGSEAEEELSFVAMSPGSIANSDNRKDYGLASLGNELSLLSVRKRALILPDGALGLTDDVRTNFIRHAHANS